MRQRLLTLVLALGLLATPALASVDEIQLQVKGVACPFCVFGIEKSLKKVPGVVSLETTIRTGVVRIVLEPDAPLDANAINEAVKNAGFTPASIEATVTGKLVTKDDKPALESNGSGQVLLLVQPGKGSAFQFITNETLNELKQASDEGSKLLTISGRVHSHVGMPPALAVETFKVAS